MSRIVSELNKLQTMTNKTTARLDSEAASQNLEVFSQFI